MLILLERPVFLIVFAALGYAGATIAMRFLAHGNISSAAAIAVGLFLAMAVLAEIILLRRMHLGLAYIAILGLETLIVVAIAAAVGEGFGPREALGAALIFAGTIVLAQ